MTARRDFDQTLTAWLSDEAGAGGAQYLEETLVLLDRTPQRRWRGAIRRALPIELPRLAVSQRYVYVAAAALLVLALVVAAVVAGSQRRLPPPIGPVGNGLIAFDDGTEVWVSEADGSNRRMIEGGLGVNWNAAFSPDGTLVAFWSAEYRDARATSLWVAPADGSAPARELGMGVPMYDPPHVPPAWAPDSRQIAYNGVSAAAVGIHVASIDGGQARYVAGSMQESGFPAWSPDGRWIAFRTIVDGRTRLEIVRPDGSDQRELASVQEPQDAFTQVAWSPDSTRIAYHIPVPGKPRIVEVTDLAGNKQQISRDGVTASVPTWSPDGRRIAYLEEFPTPGGYDEMLVVVAADGTDRRELGPVASCVAWWSPDGRYLITYGEECFAPTVAIIPVETGEEIQTVDLPGNIVGAPSWQRVAKPLFPWQ